MPTDWKCDCCHEEKETLYFIKGQELCDGCKRKTILCERKMTPDHENRKEKESNGQNTIH